MARDLAIRIVVDNSDAQAKLRATDAAVDQIADTAARSETSVSKLVTAQERLGQTANILATVGLPQWSSALSTVAVAETEATVATTGLAAATSLLVTNFPLFAAGAVVVGEALVKIAKWYYDAELATETAAAKQDVIIKAISEGAPKWITYGDAVKYVNQKFEEQQTMIPAVAAARYNEHLQEMWEKQVKAALAAHALAEGLAANGRILGEEGIGDKLKKQFEDGEKAITKAREAHDKWLESVRKATEHYDLSTFALHRYGQQLMDVHSSIEGVDTALDHLESETLVNLHTRLQKIGHEGIEPVTREVGLLKGAFTQLAEHFQPASLFSSLVHSGMTAIFGPYGIINDLAKKGLEELGKVVLKGLEKIGGYFKNLFGGPDSDELAGRALVEKFQSNFGSVDEMINKVGDAVKANGGTAEDAQALIKAMWDAEKQGAGATEAAIKKVQDALNGVKAAQADVYASGGGRPSNDFPELPHVPEFHHGGVILPFVPRAHRGLAIDEVPIIAQTGEGILNRGAMSRIGGAGGLNTLNAGGGLGGGSTVVQITIDRPMLGSLMDAKRAGRELGSALSDELYSRKKVGRG